MMQQETDQQPERPTIASLASAMQTLRGRIDSLKEAHKKELRKYEDMLKNIEIQITEAMDNEGLTNVRTPDGTIFFTTLDKFHVVDREVFFGWMLENQAVDVLTLHLSAEGVRAREELPAGVEVTYIRQLRIRKA